MKVDDLSNWIGTAGALGTAAFGLVEAAKWTPLGSVGLGKVKSGLGPAAMASLRDVYGKEGFDAFLAGTYRKGSTELGQVLRDGLRLALNAANADTLATAFGQDGTALKVAVARFAVPATPGALDAPAGQDLEDRTVVGRFELAVDARVQAVLAEADDYYGGMMRLCAGVLAIAASVLVDHFSSAPTLGAALLVGIVAVPIAPATKDLMSLLSAATATLGVKGRLR